MSDTRIVIGQRGWVYVGHVAMELDMLVLTRAKVIRQWGTTKGLGELVNGPTAKTVLDAGGTFRIHVLAVVAQLDVNPERWAEALK